MAHYELIIFFFIIAFIYSSVGFGGGSSYLALLALYSFPYQELRFIALACNIIVVTGGTIIFILHKELNWRKVIPLVITSIPLSFLGATLKISQNTFFLLLGITLIISSLLLWISNRSDQTTPSEASSKSNIFLNMGLGGVIGFISGMVGIGGGIFLSPLLNLYKWDTSKKIAATASVFILVNSMSGIAGQLKTIPSTFDVSAITLLCIAVFAGGQLGSRISAIKFNHLVIRRMTAVLVFAAGVEVLVKHI